MDKHVEEMVAEESAGVPVETPILVVTSTLSRGAPEFYLDYEDLVDLRVWDLKKDFQPLVNVYDLYYRKYCSKIKNSAYKWIFYIHDDVVLFDHHWIEKIRHTIHMYPNAAVIGFGGANELGSPDIYKVPYEKSQLRRAGYWSNVVDAEKHGIRYPGVQQVATVDGFCLGVRTELLDKVNGWPTGKLRFHNYDHWICLMARRHGYDVLGYGIDCVHYGGRTSLSPEYAAYQKETGMTDLQIHDEAHVYIYNEFKDVLPVRIYK